MFSNKFSKLFLNVLSPLNFTWAWSSSSSFINAYKFAKNMEEGLKAAQLKSKPLILIVHKTHCSACRSLIPRLANSNEMKKLSQYFVMVNAVDGNDSKTKSYAPDGAYVPRIVFVGSDGKILTEVTNPSNTIDEYKYHYRDVEDVVKSMRKALKLSETKT